MRETTIARNYAEALVALARKADDLEGWGTLMHAFAEAVSRRRRFRRARRTP
jgi:F-type H+-transporting ATPase subunit delta